ncbi:sugar phosphate permease [Novosphingobium kunmingense]|uniref:Sugar phosphate permease n=1 Tax=Novosphingobium kunmingense TaxID=1211806 RepID=A0A2N0HJQ9_9SPHN|nr:MFS transporter [Novosphingobium kunmingense]PKB19172.1 sugar phosphate permease [Novosphingobium kunmingense]
MSDFAGPAPAGESEWTRGWRIVLGCALASGTGIVLLFFTFNLMVLPLATELGVSRGEIGAIQALVVTGAIGSVVIGRVADIWGFRATYLACAAATVAAMLIIARYGETLAHMAIGVAVLGFLGVGTAALVTTRPVNAHFHRYRGRALGLVATGVSITAILAPLVLAPVIAAHGWRGGFAGLAALMALVGMPAVWLIVPRGAGAAVAHSGGKRRGDWSFLKTRDFRLMGAAVVAMGLATTGFVGQLSPIVQAEGFDASVGALAVSAFAAGQFIGRLGGGWLLDTFRPQTVALVFTIVPGAGFVLLLATDQTLWAALLAAGMIGLQQGVELDLFAYFVARRFPLAAYGTVYGALLGTAWIGNAAGIVGVGMIHDSTGSYDLAQAIGMAALTVGALLVWAVHLPPLGPRPMPEGPEGSVLP